MGKFFVKTVGGWRFAFGSGNSQIVYLAVRNEAGFAHRQWELSTLTYTFAVDRLVQDQLSTRDECVQVALEHYKRSQRVPA